jgi:transcription factor WhiB
VIEWGRPEWSPQAKCHAWGGGPDFYFPVKEKGRDTTSEVRAAKAVCNGTDGRPPCPVRQQCLDYALEHHEKFGVWGGRSERERGRLKKIQRQVKVLATSKIETRILGAIQRHLMIRPPEDRASDVIHPSEMCKSDWCPRRTFFRIVGAPAGEDPDPPSFTLENVFAEGHEIHGKWQTWLWEMGLLRGQWLCDACGHEWTATAPKYCPKCKAGQDCIEYREVPLHSEKYLVSGHADGDIADDEIEKLCALMEVKSIGVGTLRFEAPKLLTKHTHKITDDDGAHHTVVDLEGVWRDIRRPFPTHMRQAMIYLAISGRQVMVFIYESKWNQQVKEFRVRYQPELVADLLDACLDIKYALNSGKPPRRPDWAEAADGPTCKSCQYSDTCWDPYMNEAADEDLQSGSRNGRESSQGQGQGRKRRIPVTASSGLRNT